jgi:hypothetical protein
MTFQKFYKNSSPKDNTRLSRDSHTSLGPINKPNIQPVETTTVQTESEQIETNTNTQLSKPKNGKLDTKTWKKIQKLTT